MSTIVLAWPSIPSRYPDDHPDRMKSGTYVFDFESVQPLEFDGHRMGPEATHTNPPIVRWYGVIIDTTL